MEECLISVIMPVHNSANTLRQTVESVLQQSFTNWELIIIDDYSSDSSRTIEEEYRRMDDRISVICNRETKGVSESRIIGAKKARGKCIALLDSDDLWDGDKLSVQASFISKQKYVFSFTASAFVRNADIPVDWISKAPEKVTYKQLLKHDIISTSSVLIDRQIFLKYAFSPERDVAEDYFWWLTIVKNGYTALGIDKPLITYRLSSSSLSSNKFLQMKKVWNTYREIGMNTISSILHILVWAVHGIRKYLMISVRTGKCTTE